MNVLIIGLGAIAQKHIHSLNELGSFTVYALRSSLNSHNIDNVINVYSYDELIDIEIDFAIISNPTSEHKKAIQLLLKYKKCALFIEKPLYHTSDLEDLLEQVKKETILTYVACNLRFLDCLVYVKDKLNNSNMQINEINVYCGSYLPEWRNGDFRTSYSATPELGGGVHLDLIHEIDYIYWLFQKPTKVNSTFKNNSTLHIDAFDYANYCMEYASFCVNVILNYYRRDYKRTLEILFEDETWMIDLAKNKISTNNNILFSSEQKIIDTYTLQMKYFVELVEKKRSSSFNSIEEAYTVLQICLGYNETKK